MRTKEMKNNKSMRTGVILAVIALITLIALIVTFAKYASQGTGEDNARVAKWGLNVNENLDLKLFSSSYKDPLDQSVTVDASDDASVVAPGTSKQAEVKLGTYSGQAPEVMYHFEPSLSITNLGDTGQDLIEKLNENKGFTWTLKVNDSATTSYNTTDEICSAVSGLGQKDIAPNTYPTNFGPTDNPKITIGWSWDFTEGGDQSDTELGNLVANGNLKAMKVELGIKAYQCQGCSTEKKDPNLQTTAPDNLTLQINDASSFSASTDSDGVMSIVSADPTVASVTVADTNSSSKNFSIKGVSQGSTQVTISVPETSSYKAATKTISIDVTKKTPSLELDSYKKDYTVPTAGTFEYKYVGDGTVTVTSSDETKATAEVDKEKNIVTVTPKSAGTVVITVSAAEGEQYEAISVTHNATVIAGTISVTTNPATDLVYNGGSQNLGNITTVPSDAVKEYRLSEEEEWSKTEPTETNAGDYIVYYRASKDGYETIESSFEVTIDKAENPTTFVLSVNEFSSQVNETKSINQYFTPASGAPEESTVTYDVSFTPSEKSNFYISDETPNTLVCAAGTGIDIYTVTITAKAPETANYLAKDIPQNCTWTVCKEKQVSNLKYANSNTSTEANGAVQNVNFVPAFSDASYLKDNNVKYFTNPRCNEDDQDPEIKSLIENGCTMNDLYQKLFTGDVGTSAPKTLYVSANSGVKFYAVVDDSWYQVFDDNTVIQEKDKFYYPTQLNKSGNLYKTFLDDTKGIGTVYFNGKDGTERQTTGNWDAHGTTTSAIPTLNGVKYSSSLSDFYGAYSRVGDTKYQGSILSYYAYVGSSSRSRYGTQKGSYYGWTTTTNKWSDSLGKDSYNFGYVLSLTF